MQNGKLGVIVSSKGKRVKNKNSENYIVMQDGKRYEGQVDSNEFSTTKFSEYGILVEKDVPKLIAVGASAGILEAKSTMELLLTQNKDNRNPYIAELMWRLSLPISAAMLILLSISLSFINPRTGRSMNIVIALLLFVIYNNLLGVSHSLVSTGVISIWFGYWPIHLAVGLSGLYLLYRRSFNLPLLPQKISKRRKK